MWKLEVELGGNKGGVGTREGAYIVSFSLSVIFLEKIHHPLNTQSIIEEKLPSFLHQQDKLHNLSTTGSSCWGGT
jgi:hypothetical protein